MANLIPASVQMEFTGVAMDHFDTFKRTITVYKEPLKIVSNTNDNVFPGFEQLETATVEYIVQSGIFEALKVVPKQGANVISVPEANISVLNTKIRVKVKEDAMKYITEGKTEAIIFGGVTYNAWSRPIPVDFLGLQFYYFDLQQTN